jgi:hypothetical protein
MGTLILLLALVAQKATTAAEQQAQAARQASSETSVQPVNRTTRAAVDSLLAEEAFRVQELVAVRSQQTDELETKRDELAHVDDHIARLRQQLQRLNDEVQQATGEKDRPSHSDRDVDDLKKQVEIEKGFVEQLKQHSANRTPRVVIVPHKGPNGTDRRPVYLECDAEGITVWPEGSKISREQLASASDSANPLDAALRAIRLHVMQNYGDTTPPYPLLVVRPDGIETYGVARRAMQDWDDQFGYELVPQEVKLAFPKPDANLKQRIDVAISMAVAEQKVRTAMMQRAGGRVSIDGGTRAPRTTLPVLSAAALDRAGRANGFGPLRDVGRDMATSTASPAYSQEGPQIGSASRGTSNSLTDEVGDTGAAARRMAAQMENAAKDMRSEGESAFTARPAESSDVGASGSGSQPQNSDPIALGAYSGEATAGPFDLQAPNLQNPSLQNPSLQDSNLQDSKNGGSSDSTTSATGPSVDSRTKNSGNSSKPSSATAGSSPNSTQSMMSMSADAQGSSTMQGSPIMMESPKELPPDMTPPANMRPSASLSPPTELVSRNGSDWALPESVAGSHGNAIVRTIRIQCDVDRFVLLPGKNEGATEIFGIFNGDVDRASLELATAVRRRIEEWGPALPGGRWYPRIEVQVQSRGETRFRELVDLFSGSGIELVRGESR